MQAATRKWVLGSALALGLSTAVLADDLGLSNKYARCMDQSGGVTAHMLNCIGEETKYQDGLLNKFYKELMALLSDDFKKQLRDTQRAWIKYRDLNCDFYLDFHEGTMAAIVGNGCYLDSTAARARELEGFVNYWEVAR